MALLIQKAGLATSIQDSGRSQVQHLGVPCSGAADVLSLAIANYLVGNDLDTPALEFTLLGGTILFKKRIVFALAGAYAPCSVNGITISLYEQIISQPGDVLTISAITGGARLYMAVSGYLKSDAFLGSCATYAPGGFGGHSGRNLIDGDILEVQTPKTLPKRRYLEKQYRPIISGHIVVRAVEGSEIVQLSESARNNLFTKPFVVSGRISRMGIEFESPVLEIQAAALMKSSAVFSGLIQCPPSGKLLLLLADAQTTGGYPRVAQVIRAGRHLLGQLRAGSSIRFLRCVHRDAAIILRKKNSLYAKLFGENIF